MKGCRTAGTSGHANKGRAEETRAAASAGVRPVSAWAGGLRGPAGPNGRPSPAKRPRQRRRTEKPERVPNARRPPDQMAFQNPLPRRLTARSQWAPIFPPSRSHTGPITAPLLFAPTNGSTGGLRRWAGLQRPLPGGPCGCTRRALAPKLRPRSVGPFAPSDDGSSEGSSSALRYGGLGRQRSGGAGARPEVAEGLPRAGRRLREGGLRGLPRGGGEGGGRGALPDRRLRHAALAVRNAPLWCLHLRL